MIILYAIAYIVVGLVFVGILVRVKPDFYCDKAPGDNEFVLLATTMWPLVAAILIIVGIYSVASTVGLSVIRYIAGRRITGAAIERERKIAYSQEQYDQAIRDDIDRQLKADRQ